MTEIKKAGVWALVFSFVILSYVLTAHMAYSHGFDAGFHEITVEANQD